MARPNEQQIQQRQVINTIEDTSKYQTGEGRRLRVVADPLRIGVTPAPSQLGQLTDALGSIKPSLRRWAIDKQTETNIKAIEAGKLKGQTGGVTNGELEQYGYDTVKAVNDWTDFNQKIVQEYEQNFDKDEGNLDEFLKAQWESNKFDDKSDDYMRKFSPLVGKTMESIRGAHGKYIAERTATLNDAEISRLFAGDIQDVTSAGLEYDGTQYESRREGLRIMFPGKTNRQLDELAYQAVLSTMEVTGDTSLVDIFKKPHADRTPGLYEIPKWRDKIDRDVNAVLTAKNTERAKRDSENEKALKNAADVIERDVLFTLADIDSIEDPQEKQDTLNDLSKELRASSELGLPISHGVINAVTKAARGIDKDGDTKAQERAYVKLRLSNPTRSQIAAAFNNDEISKGSFDKLMSKVEAKANSAGTKEKPLSTEPYVKEMFKTIRDNAGYSFGSMAPKNEEAKKNADEVNSRMLDAVEEQVANNVPLKEAVAKATEMGVKMLKEAGLASESRANAASKIDAVNAKKANPVQFYGSDLKTFRQDQAAGILPPMPPKQLKALQAQAKAQQELDAKLKQRGRTK